MTISSIPLGLRHALESGECVLFIGAGIGGHLLKDDGSTAPDAASLAQELNKHYGLGTSSEDLSKVSQIVEARKNKQELEDFIRKRLANLTPDKFVQWLATIRWRAIFTTNYDNGLERAYELQSKPPQKAITIATTAELVAYDPRFEVPIYHIHGALFGNRSEIVITKNDYARFRQRREMLFAMLKKEFATSTILYIGYRNSDPNWDLVLDELYAEFYPSPLPHSYRVAPSTDPTDAEILLGKNIETIDSEFSVFSDVAASQLKASTVDPDRLRRLQATIPTELADAFERNAAATARLVSSWEYVNQAAFSDPPNTRSFLHGDRPNWALIGQGHHFLRDVEEEVYEDILDYVTGSAKSPTAMFVLSPAGYGTTTVLMSVAVRLVKERVGPVYFLRPTAQILEGDVEFATSLTTDVICFVVDNAADCASGVQRVVTHMRNLGRPAIFLCGERLNEWRQQNIRISGKEHPIEVLSDVEIGRLLDCLGRHRELNKLEPLNRDLQFSVVKGKLGKELLVAMREATEDKQFDTILESEYYGILNDSCRNIYLAVCCLFQHGCYTRDVLIAEIAGIPFADLHSRTKNYLDGVVIYECIDEASAQYAARARHRTVAQIVWERCGNTADRNRVLQDCLERLNLNYKTDVVAFEKLVRNDRLVDSIRDLEGKIRFFETGCKKDPGSPYVRQHYARMLQREGKLDLALGQIDQALAIDPKFPPRVLFHTRGMILGQLALELQNSSPDVARRRLGQAEEAFKRSLAINPKDDYVYHGLAILYLDWGKKSKSEGESTLYVSKAEQVITEGLRQVRVRDSLWIASSEVEKWLGDQPSRIKALETAVKETPGGIVPRYLLGRAYRTQGRFEECLSTLDPIIRGHQDEFRSFVEYALAAWELGRPAKECIAILQISTTYGLSDTRYIATLAAMLFLDGQFTEADEVLKETQKRDLGYSESHVIHFRPADRNTKKPLRMEGQVVVVRPSYSLIETPGYPKFICHSSKYSGTAFSPGLRVSFNLVFSARGAVALDPSPVS